MHDIQEKLGVKNMSDLTKRNQRNLWDKKFYNGTN